MVFAGCGCGSASTLPKKLRRETLEELLIETKLSAPEVNALYARFRRLAPTGYLLPEPFKQTMGVLGLSDDPFLPDRMFRIFDTNQDGRLSFHEFASALATMIRGTEDEKLKLSFEITAGQRGASEISFDNFQRLIHASNTMLSSLVAPSQTLSSDEDVQRLFNGISTHGGSGDECDEGDGSPTGISLEAYKLAAQNNEDFLTCLGIAPIGKIHAARCSQTADGTGARSRKTSKDAAPAAARQPAVGTPPAFVPPPDHVCISASQLEELRERVLRLETLMQRVDTSRRDADDHTLTSDDDSCIEEPWWGTLPTPPPATIGKPPLLASRRADVAIPDTLTEAVTDTVRTSATDDSTLGPSAFLENVSRELDHLRIRFGLQRPEVVTGLSGASSSTMATSGSSGGNAGSVDFRGPTLPKSAQALAGTATTCVGVTGVTGGCSPGSSGGVTFNPAARGSSCCAGGAEEPEHRTATPLAAPRSQTWKLSKPHPLNAPMSRPSSLDSPCGVTTPMSTKRVSALDSYTEPSGVVRTQTQRRKRYRLLGPKKGLAVHFGHENWNMVLSMMIGIRMAVGRVKNEFKREIQPVDFLMKEKFSIIPRLANIFDSAVSKHITMTRFFDYAPMVFQGIRASFGIQDDDYLRSVGPEQLLGNMVLGNLSSLSELSSEGKSGAFFYYTADGNYMLKTVSRKEYALLRRMLKPYYDHITGHPETLVVRFLGLHSLSVRKTRKGMPLTKKDSKVYFVVMANMFNTPFEIHRRYDLKGSWVGRQTSAERKTDPTIALKDVDFDQAKEQIRVGEDIRARLLAVLESDSAFLASNNIIDYSLLLGVHERQLVPDASIVAVDAERSFEAAVSGQPLPTRVVSIEGLAELQPACHSATQASMQSPAHSPAQVPVHRRNAGGLLSNDRQSLYFFGIIDILTPYDSFKVLEHRAKSLRYYREAAGVSCCPPDAYAARFNHAMRKVFV